MVLLALTGDLVCAPTPSLDPADRGFLQHCDVRALLRGTDAMGDPKGTGLRRFVMTPLSLELRLSVYPCLM